MKSLKSRLERLENGDSANTMPKCLAFVDRLGLDVPDLAPESEKARQDFARFVHKHGGPGGFVENVMANPDVLEGNYASA